jgi:hypothetical protein
MSPIIKTQIIAVFEELAKELEPQLKSMSNFRIGKTGQTIENNYNKKYSQEYNFYKVVDHSSKKDTIDSLEMYLIERFHSLPNCDNEQIGGGDIMESGIYIVYIVYNKQK